MIVVINVIVKVRFYYKNNNINKKLQFFRKYNALNAQSLLRAQTIYLNTLKKCTKNVVPLPVQPYAQVFYKRSSPTVDVLKYCLYLEMFNSFGSYKTHLKKCFDEISVEDEQANTYRSEMIEAYNAVAIEDEDVRNFRDSVEKEAFRIACKFNAIMMLPRDLVYNTMKDFSQFLQRFVVDGMYITIIII